MVAETYRLVLRPVERGDAAATAALMTADVADRLLGWTPLSVAEALARIAEAQRRLAARQGADLAIVRRLDNRLIGWLSAGLRDRERGLGTLSYWIGSAYQDQGFMSEAARAALPWLVELLALKAIEVDIQSDNFASQAVVEGLGFQLKGRRRVFAPTRGIEEEVTAFSVPAARLTTPFVYEERAYAMM